MDVDLLQQLMRHRDPQTTRRYINIAQPDAKGGNGRSAARSWSVEDFGWSKWSVYGVLGYRRVLRTSKNERP